MSGDHARSGMRAAARPGASGFRPELLDLPDVLQGAQVTLRAYRPGDGAAFFEAVDGDRADLARWVAWTERYRTPEDAEVYVRRMHAKWHARDALIFGIWSSDDGRYLGGTGFHGFDWAVPSLELGYFLRVTARGRGCGTEALRLLVDFGFSHLAARRQWASVDTLNAPSIALLERCGFAREAHQRSECRDPRGALRDTYLYAIVRD